MSVKLLTEHHMEFVNLNGSCTGSPEFTLINLPHFGNQMWLIYYVVKPITISINKIRSDLALLYTKFPKTIMKFLS